MHTLQNAITDVNNVNLNAANFVIVNKTGWIHDKLSKSIFENSAGLPDKNWSSRRDESFDLRVRVAIRADHCHISQN